ncbi:D-alanine--poly(phosphoribitol) ligase [Bordetella holmesii]|uniref:D-alanine--poly(Phosphoribitol) ligase subunit 1 n=2 Tax=Bordetella holmesii TaxID=35814 RepID=A0ABN0S4S9_9BORD|nr:D-alanine--poly(phosphoribitol) ligase [Bordetella holmesii]AIT26646.1 D-alanine--poly(phosphoribitol) ligase subunit 1 [Bordetella holmesii 44057]EWM42911.1 D-alanine--poly(phosphoribitol) ligase subunit 1 [Bordetella holmesii 41130]EWM51387.1 D-alanine--poly(phosphoribitol) ligase subunit 1 [Bordetella holmesii 70147]AMD45619.1 D-alanine--poly(phosphoribitol) ligase [Bordetella holmesii H558]AMD48952.1 D-alanine--D-alanine ligase [Bordetella holmesii F627]
MRFDLSTFEFVASERDPQALAVVGADGQLSWAELEQAAAAWVERARARNITADVPVVVYGHKQTGFFVAMVGALMLGAPFVPVDTIYPAERLRRIVEIVGAGTVYDAAADRFEPGAAQPRALDEKSLAYVIFTSGSTGDPKGVQIGRESVALLGQWMSTFGLGDAPVFMNQAPFSFDLSMYEVFGTLALGGTCVLSAREQIAAPADWYTRLAAHGIRCWVSTPSFAHQQLVNRDFSPATLPALDTFLFCGEPLTVALAKKLRQRFPLARIINTYGPTEATVATTAIVVDDAVIAAHDPLPIGYAKPDSRVYVEEGELCIVGDHVMRGYLNRPDLNETKCFRAADGRRGFRTGDLGEQGEGGLLFCRGRMDDQIKLNGYRIELSEIDAALHGLTGVRGGACAVLRRPDGTAVRLIGFLDVDVSAPAYAGADVQADWKRLLAERLPPYMVPTEWVLCPSLPVSNNHKTDRKKLLEIYASL